MPKEQLVEIARSFSYKVNTGDYQPKDFFCSQKAECNESEAEKVSESLHEFCKKEVMKSVNKYLKEITPKVEEPKRIPEPVVERDVSFLKEIQNKDLQF